MVISCTPLPLPASLHPDDPLAAAWVAASELSNRANAARWGAGMLHRSAADRLATARAAGEAQQRFQLRRDGQLIGAAVVLLPGHEAAQLVEGGCTLDLGQPDQVRAQVAVLVRDLLERTARQTGRSQIWAESEATADGIDPEAPDVIPLLAHGYRLAQITRSSVLDLSQLTDLEQRLARANRRTADQGNIRLRRWRAPTPARFADQLCRLHEQLARDEPGGNPDESWHPARLAEVEQQALAGGNQLLIVAAEDATGQLVGWSQLLTGADGTARQGSTLVLPAHRGRGLAVRLKLANLAALRGWGGPDQRVLSFTAETNQAIHRVNERVGFVAVHWGASWTRNLGDEPNPRD